MNVANSSEVIEHYNSVPNTGIREREGVRIYYLRCFNNWIKTKLFNKAEILLREQGRSNLVGLDLCCGKGGDLLKWNHMDVSHVVFTDIAGVSLEQCERRYKESTNARKCKFTAEFIKADATREHLKDLYKNPAIEFDLCSCQFSFHYAFETERQARVMIRNAIEMLKPGGLFLGTLPEAERIMFFLRKGFGCYSNDVVRLTYGDQELFQKENYRPPIFGAKFHFALEEQVNCPEYLVHFPVMEKLMMECGMELVYKKRFSELAREEMLNNSKLDPLISRINALEPYPPQSNSWLKGSLADYSHAEAVLYSNSNEGTSNIDSVGTLSKSEWEVVTMYHMFIFRKK